MPASETRQRLVERLLGSLDEGGVLAARAAKYTAGRQPAEEMLRALMALGDRARSLDRRGALEARAAGLLLAEIEPIREQLRALLDRAQRSPEHLAARRAASTGDGRALGKLIPLVFADVVAVAPSVLHYPAPLRKHGKPRPPEAAAAAIAELLAAGLPAEGDPDTPGADELLPAVILWESQAAAGEAVTLRVDPGDLLLPLFCLRPTGQRLVYTPRLHVRLDVEIARAGGAGDAEELEQRSPGYAEALAAELSRLGCPLVMAVLGNP